MKFATFFGKHRSAFLFTLTVTLCLTAITFLLEPESPSHDMAADERKLEDITKALQTRNFVGWKGLPKPCPPERVFNDFPTDLKNRPARALGSSLLPSTFVIVDLNGYYRPTASIRDRELILFDGMLPELHGGFERLREDLGEPASRLDWTYGTLSIQGGEWVYPERGITVFLDPTVDKVLHIAVYQSTDLDEYLTTLRPNYEKVLWPLEITD